MKIHKKDFEMLFSNSFSIDQQLSGEDIQNECVEDLTFYKNNIFEHECMLSLPYMEPRGSIYLRTPFIEGSTLPNRAHIKCPVEILTLNFCSDGIIDCDVTQQRLQIKLSRTNWLINTEFESSPFVTIVDYNTMDSLSIPTDFNVEELSILLGTPEIKKFSDTFFDQKKESVLYFRKQDKFGYTLILKISMNTAGCSIKLLHPKTNTNSTPVLVFNIEFYALTRIICDLKENKIRFIKNDDFTPIVIDLESHCYIMIFDCDGCNRFEY